MKYVLFLIVSSFVLSSSFSQTFRTGFDKRDASSGGGNGQGLSYHANVKSDVHNIETVYLKGYINMFQATNDKKYLNQFISQSGRLLESNNNLDNAISECKVESCLQLNNKQEEFGRLKHGFSLGIKSSYLLTEQFGSYNFSYSVDLDYSLIIRKNFLFQAGVLFDDLKSYMRLNLSIGGVLIDRNIYDYYRFVGFPLKLNFLHQLGKIQVMAGIGSALSILTYNHSKTIDDVNGTIEKSRFNNGSKILLFTSNCGINYCYNKNISIGIVGEFRHSLTPLKEWTTNTSGEIIHYDRRIKYYVFGVRLNYFFN